MKFLILILTVISTSFSHSHPTKQVNNQSTTGKIIVVSLLIAGGCVLYYVLEKKQIERTSEKQFIKNYQEVKRKENDTEREKALEEKRLKELEEFIIK